MGHNSSTIKQTSKPSSLKRHKRWEDRSARRRRLCLEEIEVDCNDNQENTNPALIPQNEPEMAELYRIFEETETEVPEVNVTTASTGTQTELSLIDIEILENCATSKPIEESISRESFEKDADKLKFYTGLPAITVFMAVLNLISPGLVLRSNLTKFQQLLLTLMRLRLNLSVQDLGYRFGIHDSTVSRVFQSCIQTMYSSMDFLVYWPEREQLKLTLPMSFRQKFSSCAVIIDCFEVFIDRPSDLLARAQTWSSYKHHNTAKYLIGITPQGTVSFISKGWGGRTSDKFITEHCAFLKNLLPGDLVLADRGFDIQDSCGLYCARLQIPSYTKGKPQLSPVEIETTRSIANVRIHVERVIGCVRQKYTILGHGIVPIDYLKSTDGAPCLLDKIAFVSCALTNCCKSVVSPD